MATMSWDDIRNKKKNTPIKNNSQSNDVWNKIRAARGIQTPQPTQTPQPAQPTPTPEAHKQKRYGLFGENSLFNDIKTGVKKLQAKGEQRTRETYGPKTPELQLSKALREEKSAEVTANVFTAPVRFTAGSLATLVTSYALEKANSNKKYTPKTDAEKLIIGKTDIQRLTQQEDIYGIVARSTSIPVALTLAAIIENPFLKGTGAGTFIKTSLENAIEKKVISTIGTKELIRIADEAIQAEVKVGKLTPEEALKASSDINNFRVKELPPAKKLLPSGRELKPKIEGDGFTMSSVVDDGNLVLSKANQKYQTSLTKYNANPTEAGLKTVLKNRETVATLKTKSKPLTPISQPISPVTQVPTVNPVQPTVKPITPDIPKDTFTPKVSQRISDQAIAEGLVKDAEDFGELPVQQVQHLKDQALIMGKIIDEDPELLKEIARGKASYPGLNPSHAFITVKNQALKNNDLELLRELATSPSAVPQQATEAGRLIQALDESSDDAFKNIKKVVDSRKDAVKDKISKEVSSIKKENIIKKSSPKKDEWLSFLDEIKCPK